MKDFDDIIFRDRNKEYGAFYMRRRYPVVLTLAAIITLFVFVIIMLVWMSGSGYRKPGTGEISYLFNISDTSLNRYTEQRKPVQPSGGQVMVPNYAPMVVDSVPAGDTTVNTGAGNGTDTAGHGSGSGHGDGPIFYSVQQPPLFPGGDAERIKFIQRSFVYPPEARQKKIHGKVFIALIIEKDGSVSNVKLLQGIGYGCDEEALRVVRSMPSWRPGQQNGEPVRVYYICPIVF
jgi:periplasmic protein TonB